MSKLLGILTFNQGKIKPNSFCTSGGKIISGKGLGKISIFPILSKPIFSCFGSVTLGCFFRRLMREVYEKRRRKGTPMGRNSVVECLLFGRFDKAGSGNRTRIFSLEG